MAEGEGAHPEEAAVSKAVGVESDSEEIGAEPGPGGDDVAEDGECHDSAFLDDAAPAGVEGDGAHDNDHEGAVFFGIPAPKAAPALVGPDAAEDSADETEEGGETGDAVNHPGEGSGRGFVEAAPEESEEGEGDGKGSGEEHGGVAEGDDDDVGREPEVGVEDGAHHLEGVAGHGEVVGNDEGGESDQGGHGGTDAIAIEAFEEGAEEDGAPTDEDGGGVEVGNGGAVLDIHACRESKGMERKGEAEGPEGGVAEGLGPAEPGDANEEEDEDVKLDGDREGLVSIKDPFEVDASNVVGEIGSDAFFDLGEGFIKGFSVSGAVCHREAGVAHGVGAELSGLDNIEEFVAEVQPIIHRIDGGGWWDDAEVGGLGKAEVVLAETEEGFDEIGIVFLAGLLFAEFRHSGLEEAEVAAVFVGELVEALGVSDGMEGMHDAVIAAEPVVELGDLALVGVTFFRLGVDLAELLIDGLKMGAEVVEGVVPFAGLGEAFESEVIGEFDFKDGVGVGALGSHREVEEPFDRAEGLSVEGFNFLAGGEDKEGIARHGIEGLDAPADLHGEFRKTCEVITGVLRGGAQVTAED